MRRGRQAEASAVLELWAHARRGHASTPDRIDDVERLASESPAVLFVAEREGQIVGTLIAAWDRWRGNMYRLAVRDEHRREGIGLALIRAGEDCLRLRGARRVTALVALDDEVAAGFWEAAGYPLDREIGRRPEPVAAFRPTTPGDAGRIRGLSPARCPTGAAEARRPRDDGRSAARTDPRRRRRHPGPQSRSVLVRPC